MGSQPVVSRSVRAAARRLAVVALVASLSWEPFALAQPNTRSGQRERVIGMCERLLVQDARKVAATDTFEVITDSPSGTAAGILAGNFESVFHVLWGLFPMIDDEQPKESTERMREFYAVSWLFIDFLRHGRPTWARSQFPHFLIRVGKGESPSDALTATYGIAAADLERDFRQYVKDFELPLDRSEQPRPIGQDPR
jgi:hypothetical protein